MFNILLKPEVKSLSPVVKRLSLLLLLGVTLFIGGSFSLSTVQAQGPIVTVRVTITNVNALNNIDTFDGADFFPKVTIDGEHYSRSLIDNKDYIQPSDWTFSKQVPLTKGEIPITIEIWDYDSGFNGDSNMVDLAPGSGKNLVLTLNLDSCRLDIHDDSLVGSATSGNPNYPSDVKPSEERCTMSENSHGSNGDRASIWYQVEVSDITQFSPVTDDYLKSHELTPHTFCQWRGYHKLLVAWSPYKIVCYRQPVRFVNQSVVVPLYSWWNPQRGDNFASTNPHWSGQVGAHQEGYTLYRIEGWIYNPARPQPHGTVPLYSWWNAQRGDNFVSTNPYWSGPIGTQKEDYTLYRLEGYIFDPAQPQPSGTVPLYSWWNPARGDNFATTDIAWAGKVGTRQNGYTLYRLEGYIYPE